MRFSQTSSHSEPTLALVSPMCAFAQAVSALGQWHHRGHWWCRTSQRKSLLSSLRFFPNHCPHSANFHVHMWAMTALLWLLPVSINCKMHLHLQYDKMCVSKSMKWEFLCWPSASQFTFPDLHGFICKKLHLSNLIYTFNAIQIKNPACYIVDINKLVLKFIWKG